MKNMKALFAAWVTACAFLMIFTSCGDKKKADEAAPATETVKKTYTEADFQAFYDCNSACIRQLILDLLKCKEKFPKPADSAARKQCEDDAWKAYRKCFEDCDKKTR